MSFCGILNVVAIWNIKCRSLIPSVNCRVQLEQAAVQDFIIRANPRVGNLEGFVKSLVGIFTCKLPFGAVRGLVLAHYKPVEVAVSVGMGFEVVLHMTQ